MLAKGRFHQVKIRISALHRRNLSASASASATASGGGYKSIGSFHSDNVEELIRLPKDEYTSPALPFATENNRPNITLPKTTVPFANANHYAKAYYTHLDRDREGWAFLNHGAFGLALDVGLERSQSWRTFLESQPLREFEIMCIYLFLFVSLHHNKSNYMYGTTTTLILQHFTRRA